MKQPHVIILNGVGSVGKSSTARALQKIATKPFMHVAMDEFIGMLPEHMFGQADGLVFEKSYLQGKPIVAIKTGTVVEKALRGMRHAVAALAAQGNNVVVDDVMIGEQALEYRKLLSPFRLRFVGLFAPLEILEAREIERGDRDVGLARWQFDRVHQNITYDLKLDTADRTPAENAQIICDTFEL